MKKDNGCSTSRHSLSSVSIGTVITWNFLHAYNRLVGLVVKRPPRERKIPGSNPAWDGIFSGSSHTSDLKLALQWLPCQAPGVIGSALGLVGPTGWDGKFGLQLLSQCGSTLNCLSRSVPEIHSHVAGTLSKQASKQPTKSPRIHPQSSCLLRIYLRLSVEAWMAKTNTNVSLSSLPVYVASI